MADFNNIYSADPTKGIDTNDFDPTGFLDGFNDLPTSLEDFWIGQSHRIVREFAKAGGGIDFLTIRNF